MTRLAVVGCGLAGRKRALGRGAHEVVAVADADPARADALAAELPGAEAVASWADAIAHPEVEAVVVATPHHLLAPVAVAALEAGRHVLVEKPGARTPSELDAVAAAADAAGRIVRVGYNHRFHPALAAAHEVVTAGELGDVLFVRGTYGHGGRPGYEHEWRADPALAGGGELLDQGSHLVDLATWFAGGPVADLHALLTTTWWPMAVEDNAFLQGTTTTSVAVQLHASWTEWKNRFRLEVACERGLVEVTGLGGSYGPEALAVHRMAPELGPPATTRQRFDGPDASFGLELEAFCAAIGGAWSPGADLAAARATLDAVARAYAQGPVARRQP